MKINCIAVDDEPLALEKMEQYINKLPYLNLTGSFDNGFSALNFLRQHPVDLMFLDIQMDELTGIQLLEVLSHKPYVVLTTAYDQYALKGYELNVTDYLLKPFGFNRFLQAVEKVKDKLLKSLSPKASRGGSINSPEQDFILVRSEYRLQKVNLKEILYVEGMKDYSRIFTPDIKLMTLQNLRKMEEALPSPPFMRIHKSYIISINMIESVGKNDITIAGQNIPIGGLYKKKFLDYIDQQRLIG